ncbi:transglutaminase family protein [Parasulfitobacter algicola]|uniref:Transglutaminase family protein n=1 Tax=Parasulfitobacter algicola TaxID=2614809 RepID=A0ABX2IPW4_9RHOB|nr:transglutaminase family protein [Sulfitobacter algicola]NSX54929.1 transglutaminase family protein [Sulfitobacter algicola]
MQLQISHTTHYRYDQPVDYSLQKVRLRPKASELQDIIDWSLIIENGKLETSYTDHYGNHTDLISIEKGAQDLTITASGTVHTSDTSGILGKIYGRAPLWHFLQPTPLTTPGERIKSLARIVSNGENALNDLHTLSAAILKTAPYQIGQTQADTNAEEALQIGSGVCQDHANIFASAARQAGFPARYVSGYLMMNDRVDQDASHAWAEVHLDDLGWVGFDISNGIAPDEKYVRIATGRDAHDAAPISGMRMGSSDESMIVSLQVQQ